MRRLILGTAGHIDHGKTALVRALTGIDTDRLPEEKKRGITIDLGFARLVLDDDTEVGIVDVPGHEAFIRNMLAGATGIDVGLLVVAADEGVMPQTREHHAILELLGVRSLVVALSKADLVEADWLDLVTEEIRELLQDGPFADAPVIAVSARTGAGLDALRDALARGAAAHVARSEDDLFRLPIDRVFTVRGTGTVVTGTVWSGTAAVDDLVRLMPADTTVRVRAIQSHGHDQPRASAGQRAALALASTARTDLKRGDTLVRGAGWAAGSIVTARVRALAQSPPLRHGQRIRFHLGTAESVGRLACLEDATIEPGQEAWAQVRLEAPILGRAGDRFVLRSWSPLATIAGGRIAEAPAPRRRRFTAGRARTARARDDLAPDQVRAALEAVLDADPAASLAGAARLAGWRGLPLPRVPLASRAPAANEGVPSGNAAGGLVVIEGVVFERAILERAAERILATVDAVHSERPLEPGATREEVRRALPPEAPPALAGHVLTDLTATGVLEAEGSAVRRAGFRPTLAADQQRLADRIMAVIGEAGLAAPTPDELPADLAGAPGLLDVLHFLTRTGRLVMLPGSRFIATAALDAAARQARAAFAGRTDLSPAEFRDLFGITRKYLIPLLEHFDRAGITARTGEARRMGQGGEIA